jgi:hemoglobin
MKKGIEGRKDIEFLIETFYSKVRRDDVIGYIFNDVAKVNWEHHTPLICDFWESILFQTGTFSGNPMVTHLNLHAISPLNKTHFDRWKELFMTTVDENFEGEKADLAKQKAQSIATMMQIKIIEAPASDLLNKIR